VVLSVLQVRQIPENDRLTAPRDQRLPVRGEGQRANLARAAAQYRPHAAHLQVPEPHLAVRPAEVPAAHTDRQCQAVGRERDAIDLNSISPASMMVEALSVARSQSFAAPPPPQASSLPSGEKDTEWAVP
jgi:hypothetical protein